MSMAEVNLRKVVKRYDDVEAVRGIDLDIADHEFVVLVGPSGCGKSTTLRMMLKTVRYLLYANWTERCDS